MRPDFTKPHDLSGSSVFKLMDTVNNLFAAGLRQGEAHQNQLFQGRIIRAFIASDVDALSRADLQVMTSPAQWSDAALYALVDSNRLVEGDDGRFRMVEFLDGSD